MLSDAIASQVDIHALYGGVVPEIASRKHVEVIAALAEQALREAGCTRKDIDAVAVTYAPGLIGAVLVGVNFAKGPRWPGPALIPVHHVRGHIAANYLTHRTWSPLRLSVRLRRHHRHCGCKSYTEMEVLGAPGMTRRENVLIRQPGYWDFRIPREADG